MSDINRMSKGKSRARRVFLPSAILAVEGVEASQYIDKHFLQPFREYKRLHPEFDLKAEFEKLKAKRGKSA